MYIGLNPERLREVFPAFLQSLASSERAPAGDLRRHQAGLAARLVRHAYDNVPFYRNRLTCLIRADGEIDLTRWRDVPITTRADALAHRDAMQSASLPEIYGPVTQVATTGSTGPSLRVASNALNKVATVAALGRTARWWGLDTARPLAAIKMFSTGDDAPGYPEGREWRGWCYDNLGSRSFELDMFTPVEQQIEWLLRVQPAYLITPPSNASTLAHAMTPSQAQRLGLAAILLYGETVLPRTRALVAERLGATSIAIYSCQEVGFIATQCPVTPHYHVAAENVLVEILRDDGAPAAPGEAGQVVVTGFYNYAMPFIRYALGDVATAGPLSCTCGRTLPVIAQVDGRTRHAFVFRDGTRVWPRPFLLDFTPFVACRAYQLAQIDHERLEFRYIPEEGASSPDRSGLEAYLRDKLHPSAVVTLVPVEDLPRGPGGKLTPFVSAVES
jgi:phenylacetate-CoA ligase